MLALIRVQLLLHAEVNGIIRVGFMDSRRLKKFSSRDNSGEHNDDGNDQQDVNKKPVVVQITSPDNRRIISTAAIVHTI